MEKSGKTTWVKLLPGNKVLLKRGEVFNGELEITGHGIPEDRIYIDAYGDGERKPCIVGYDTSLYAARICNSGLYNDAEFGNREYR